MSTIPFLPERLNREPAVFRGLTVCELLIALLVGLATGAITGTFPAILWHNWSLIPGSALPGGALAILCGGRWLWLATQNLSDFPDDAKKLLNMIEWWELLVMPLEEVEQVSRFKSLTPEQRQLLLRATKAPGKYTEGVVLSPRVEALFRVVSPALWLALGMTEKHEKAERMRIMREFGCSELEAAMKVAKAHAITSDVTT